MNDEKDHNDSKEKQDDNELLTPEEKRKQELERIRRWIEERRMKEKTQKDGKRNSKVQDNSNLKKDGDNRYPEKVIDEIKYEQARLKNINKSSSEFSKLSLRLDYLVNLPWRPTKYEHIDLKLAREIMDKEHFGMDEVKDNIIEYIYACNRVEKIKREIILLYGPPGTGKTSIARQIAKSLGRELHKIPLGGLSDDIYLKGCAIQYASAKPGVIVDILRKVGHRKVVILLDEIDKLGTRDGGAAASVLLDALDQDNDFLDRFLDIPINLSDIIFIATANIKSDISAPLLDRMTEIAIPPYTQKEKFHICKKYLIPKERKSYGLTSKMLKIDDKVITQMIKEDAGNAGVRGISKKVNKLCKFATKSLEESGKKSCFVSLKRAYEIGVVRGILREYTISKYPGKSITSGIDFTTGREGIIYIESIYVDGREEHKVIGSKKPQYEDIVTQLCGYLESNINFFNIPGTKMKEGSLIVNVEEINQFPLDTNHDLAIFFSIFSALTGVTLPHKHLIIGDVTLLGEVKSNGKTYNHIVNGLNAGAEILILPKDLQGSLKQLALDNDIVVHFISNLREIHWLFRDLTIYKFIYEYLLRVNNKVRPKEVLHHYQVIRDLAQENNLTIKDSIHQHFGIEDEDKEISAEEKLNSLIGMSKVKSVINDLVIWKEMTSKRESAGLKVKNVGLHMIFTGNPGTGKTTVAKILGEILYEKKLVRKNHFIQVTRDDLVGKFIGHTEEKVKHIIEKALGGVLYVDEAHSLYVDSENDFGRLAISTLVKEMEEYREDLIVIMSGYKDEMIEMVRINPGLEDRINYKIDFRDYTVDELVKIFRLLYSKEEYVASEESLKQLEIKLNSLLENGIINFSNGRFIRNIFEKAKIKHSIRISRIGDIDKKDFQTLKTIDIISAFDEQVKSQLEKDEENRRIIGFRD